MPLNSLFPSGTYQEQNLVENLIIESIKQYGQELFYIPRNLVAVDEILGEDSLSKFEQSYMIEGYIDNVDGFGGNAIFMSKFGMYIEEQAQITIARSRWESLIAQYGQVNIPSRPAEGDLLYFPLTKGLFEIKYVEHQNPFYQLGRLYVYKLKVELFQYASERIDTDITELNDAALRMTFDIDANTVPDEERLRDNDMSDVLESEASSVVNFSESNPFGD